MNNYVPLSFREQLILKADVTIEDALQFCSKESTIQEICETVAVMKYQIADEIMKLHLKSNKPE